MSGGNTFRGLQFLAGARRRAFTLIELLVVVSIITLLLALMQPVARKARRHAEAAACQTKLHQWALFLQQYTNEHDGRWVPVRCDSYSPLGWWRTVAAGYVERPYRIPQCATKRWWPEGHRRESSYAPNDWIHDGRNWYWGAPDHRTAYFWGRVDTARSPGRVPVVLDGTCGWNTPLSTDEPPPFRGSSGGHMGRFCRARHGSFVNGVFMDWSVRRVGLKELWTLKWHRQYDTSGPWTKAGGVLPTDWPQWMRGFKDY